MKSQVIEQVLNGRLIAIVRGLAPDKMLQLASALLEGGIKMVEVTFNQADPGSWADTARSISQISRHFAGRMLVGAGTVLSEGQVEMAREAGAEYIISPGFDARVVKKTREMGMVSIPGVFTPTEILSAREAGADFVKVFPAGCVGPGYIRALRAPLSHVPLMAVGGVNEKNAADFIRAGCVGLGVGGNLVNREWIEAGAFDKIRALAREYVKAVQV